MLQATAEAVALCGAGKARHNLWRACAWRDQLWLATKQARTFLVACGKHHLLTVSPSKFAPITIASYSDTAFRGSAPAQKFSNPSLVFSDLTFFSVAVLPAKMSSSGGGGGQQFRYTQTPSKVLHLRNLPWECAEEELVELCKPFGRIVNTKSGVGANRNQAFVEFTDVNQAISMVSYFASSSEPAQIRGKNVYIQYSNRQEIINNKSPGETAGNVLLVTIEGVQASDVTIDVIHMVFSAFGYVHKIATFEKAAGFQALIQYTDAATASAAREALDGRSIPSYLLPEHVTSCCLRISFSAHKDLNIKFQSNRSRDYNNPYLPINYSAMDGALQPAVGADGRKVEAQGNVLLASIENMQYAVTVDVLHTVFSAFGAVQKIAIFEKNGGTQALIQYPDATTAAVAKEALEGHCIYDGGYCKLHLSYSRHTDLNVKAHGDKSRDYTIPPGAAATSTGWQGNIHGAGAYAPPGVPAQSHSANGQVPNWNSGNSGYPPAPGAYPGQMYLSPAQYAPSGGFPNAPPAAPPQYAASGGFPTPPAASQQMPPQHQSGPSGTPGTGQPPPPPSYYH